MLTSQSVKTIETEALIMYRAKASTRSTHAALKAFIPNCARLAAQLSMDETRDAIGQPDIPGQMKLPTEPKAKTA